jgi:cytosine/adenosine deaminase-related metal-dependent hydrolase
MVHLDQSDDIPKLAASGAHIAHCPTSNAKLASGIARVPELVAAGGNVSIGADGAPCQNTCDLLQELKLAAIIQRSISHNPRLFRAETILEMGTINGARALGLADQIGSLEVGKKADLIAIDIRKPHLQPCNNPVSNVVYSATGRDVSVVVVDGQLIVDRGKVLTMDEEAIIEAAKQKSYNIIQRAGLTDQIRSIWPVHQSR